MSENSALSMALALQKKSEDKAQLIEKAAMLAFHEQEQVLGKAVEESSNTISSAINARNEDLIKALNSRNGDLSNALNELIDTFNTNNATARKVLFKSWAITLIGLVFLLLLGSGALWYQGKMIKENWDEIAQQNQQKKDLKQYSVMASSDKDGNYLILPKKSTITNTFTSTTGNLVVQWEK